MCSALDFRPSSLRFSKGPKSEIRRRCDLSLMTKLTTSPQRDIIKDFANEIRKRKETGPKPAKAVIDFRNDRSAGRERDVYYLPLELLLYRKDNGRISSDVQSYERQFGKIVERTEEGQNIIRKFLQEKDREKTEELKLSIGHDKQRDPAIITCDGFLINGNRRKMVLEMLDGKSRNTEFKTMKVVILPGEDDEGGPPTKVEIEQIENRYQLQSDGKAEYYAFDKALSMQRKIRLGMSLEDQLRDDPMYAHLVEKEFKQEVARVTSEFLGPLECIDRYLEALGREGLYNTVSEGMGDREGRWQAFYDYYKFVYLKLEDPKKLLQLNLRENEVGNIEDAAFKLIRKREFAEVGPKVHQLMRELPVLLKHEESKRQLLKLNALKHDVAKQDRIDGDGKELNERTVDKIWGENNKQEIFRRVSSARALQSSKLQRETTLNLLEAALSKLTHDDMDPQAVDVFDYQKALHLSQEIQRVAKVLEREFYRLDKEKDSLKNKGR